MTWTGKKINVPKSTRLMVLLMAIQILTNYKQKHAHIRSKSNWPHVCMLYWWWWKVCL